jgi:signal transduction histidine kinase
MHHLHETLRRVLDGQLNAATAGDSAAADRHFRFLCGQLALGVIGLAAFPVWLALGAPGSALASLSFLLLLAPLAVAAFVVRTGRLDIGQTVAAIVLTGLVLWLVTVAGGLSSPTVILFAIVPAASRLSAERHVIWSAAGFASAGLAICAALDLTGANGPSSPSATATIAVFFALGAIAAATFWALRMTERAGEAESGGELAAPADDASVPDAPAVDPPAQTQLAELTAELQRTFDSISRFSEVIADERLVAAESDGWRSYARLIRVAGESARNAIAGLLSDDDAASELTPEIQLDSPRPLTDLDEIIKQCIERLLPLSADRDVVIQCESADAPTFAALDAESCAQMLVSLFAAVLRSGPRRRIVTVAVATEDEHAFVLIRNGTAGQSRRAGQPFFQPQSPYTDSTRAADLGLAEIGERVRLLGGELKLGPRGSGGLIARLALPVAEPMRGGDRRQKERRSGEERKSA